MLSRANNTDGALNIYY